MWGWLKCNTGFHDFTEWSYLEADKCEQSRMCNRCKKQDTQMVHQWPEFAYTSPGSCEQSRCCNRCRSEEKRVAPHGWSEWDYIEDDKCDQKHTCTRCMAVEKKVTHQWGVWELEAPNSCVQVRFCRRCYTAREQKEPGFDDHQWTEPKRIDCNRTVVHLMTEMLDVQPGESVYDPTCGSGGMLLSCIAHLRNQKKEWRNVKLYGQERNLMTSSIARMNCFLHGIEDFRIERGDTLSEPKLVEGDSLMQFDVVLANPPYSIKQWDRDAFASDPWGRNLYGTPSQGRADYAFQQHILKSLKPKTGRCAVLWPHGVLFREEEAEMRRKLIEADLIECVLGLGPNLFYNSPMEACVVVCRTQKPKARRGKILFINAVNEVTRERAQSFLTDDHIKRIVRAYQKFKDEPGFSSVTPIETIRAKEGNLSIPLYVGSEATAVREGADEYRSDGLPESLSNWLDSSRKLRDSLHHLLNASEK